MHHRRATLSELRRDAAPMLLGLFLLAVQLAPVAHLAAHRSDHTHGTEPARTHAAAHRAGLRHAHGPTDGIDDERRATSRDDEPAPEHGSGSSAHFGLALIEGPPPPALPLPAERLAPIADTTPREPRAPARPQPPVRGPPPSTRASLTLSS